MTDRSSGLLEFLAGPLYWIALLLIATPLVDFVANAWPARGGEVAWRYGAVGLLSGYVLTPLLGLGLAGAIAVTLGHRPVTRILLFISLAAALVLLVASVDFSLDALQLRHNVPAPQRRNFDLGAAKALVKHGSVAVALVWLGVAMFRALRATRAGERGPVAPLVTRGTRQEAERPNREGK